MVNSSDNFRLLTKEEVFGENGLGGEKQIKVIKKTGAKAPINDFIIMLGGIPSGENMREQRSRKQLNDRSITWALSSKFGNYGMSAGVNEYGHDVGNATFAGRVCIRPVTSFDDWSNLQNKKYDNQDGLLEVEDGEYPQNAVDVELNEMFEKLFQTGTFKKTGKTYNTYSFDYFAGEKTPIITEEYEYNGKKYVRMNCQNKTEAVQLSNGHWLNNGDYIWIEVAPIRWLVDEEAKLLVSKNSLVYGIPMNMSGVYEEDFTKTDMYDYLNNVFAKDIIPSKNMQVLETTTFSEDLEVNRSR